MNNLKINLGKRIKLQRKKMNMTQEKLAESLDISVKHLSEVERGIAGLSLENLLKISNILEVNIDYLIKGDIYESKKDFNDLLNNIPEEKAELFKELIRAGIKIAK